jgi:hypothetical protein
MGFLFLLFGGVIMPLLMVIHVIDVTTINQALAWIIIFGSYGISVAGLFLGIIGFASYARLKRPPHKPEN